MVDGHSRLMAFFRVVLPLSWSGVIAVIVFTFTLTLHEFVYAMTFYFLFSPADDQRWCADGTDKRRCVLLAVIAGRSRHRCYPGCAGL